MNYTKAIKGIMAGAITIGTITGLNIFSKFNQVDKLSEKCKCNRDTLPNNDVIDTDFVDDDELDAST